MPAETARRAPGATGTGARRYPVHGRSQPSSADLMVPLRLCASVPRGRSGPEGVGARTAPEAPRRALVALGAQGAGNPARSVSGRFCVPVGILPSRSNSHRFY